MRTPARPDRSFRSVLITDSDETGDTWLGEALAERPDLLEGLEDRSERTLTLITSRLPVAA